VEDREVTGLLLLCGAIEAVAWSVAWMLEWQISALVGAVVVSTGVAGVIFELQRRKRRKG
jgi:Flp pilus assembly protein TadB